MRNLILAAAVTLAAAATGHTAQAMPQMAAGLLDNGIMTVSGGCGPYGHRGPYGGCQPNVRRPIFRGCPPGFHLGPYGGCRPNF